MKVKKGLLIYLMLTLFILYALPQQLLFGQEIKHKTTYENPEEIIIASPRDQWSTTAKNISILGASDYRYPLYMNGQEIKTTKHGFFTEYVSLEVGENVFTFVNHDKSETLTIIRKEIKPSKSENASKTEEKFITFTESTYGIVTSNYAMPRSETSTVDVSLKPLTRGTIVYLLGEKGSYYKLADGSYVAKSSIKKQKGAIDYNVVSKTKLYYKEETNQLVTELSMNTNTMYHVDISKDCIKLTLYNTIKAENISTSSTDIIKSISKTVDGIQDKVVYSYELNEGKKVYGYDILFNHGVMKFEMKVAPKQKSEGSLEGFTVYLDAGHGGYDYGAVGPMGVYGPAEKDINLAIAKYTKEYLEDKGASVVMTREDDIFHSLTQRVSNIRNLRPDLSISIHANSLDNSSNYSKSSGFLTYYTYSIGIDAVTLFNNTIAEQLNLSAYKPRVKSLSLTRFTTCPGMLFETSFMSNPEDYEYLIQPKNQQKFGMVIADAVEEYYKEISIPKMFEYRVKRGDSLLAIAREFNTTVQAIATENKIKNINYIYIGQILRIKNK